MESFGNTMIMILSFVIQWKINMNRSVRPQKYCGCRSKHPNKNIFTLSWFAAAANMREISFWWFNDDVVEKSALIFDVCLCCFCLSIPCHHVYTPFVIIGRRTWIVFAQTDFYEDFRFFPLCVSWIVHRMLSRIEANHWRKNWIFIRTEFSFELDVLNWTTNDMQKFGKTTENVEGNEFESGEGNDNALCGVQADNEYWEYFYPQCGLLIFSWMLLQ